MKKFLLFAFLLVASYAGFAQTPTTTAPATTSTTATTTHAKQKQNPAAWACPSCYAITKDGGTCAKCNMQKVQLGTYYCPKCMKGTGSKPGTCPTCGATTVQMTRKLCASHTTAKAS